MVKKVVDIKPDTKEAYDRGESVALMEPLFISEGSRFRPSLTDLAFDLAQKSAGFRRSLPASLLASEVDAEGISQYLPDELEDSETGTPQQVESLNDEPAPVLDMRIRSSPPPTPSYQPENGQQDDPSEDEGDEGGPDTSDPAGEGGEGGSEEGEGKGEHGAGGGSDGIDHAKRIGLANLRIYCADPNTGKYRLLFEPQSEGAQQLRVFVIGEVGAAPSISRISSTGGNRWNPCLIRKILRNCRYTGKLVWRKTSQAINPITEKVHKRRNPEEKWVVGCRYYLMM
jgi:hypothetical protein